MMVVDLRVEDSAGEIAEVSVAEIEGHAEVEMVVETVEVFEAHEVSNW